MWTMSRIKQANKNAGQHWFSKGTMRFFNSRVSDKVYEGKNGVFFVTSERMCYEPTHPRRYTMRIFDPENGTVDTHGEFQDYKTAHIAHEAAKYIANEAERKADGSH